MSFYLSRKTQGSYENVVERLINLLHEHDYLIAANINVQGALKEKMDADLPKICIIGTNTPSVGLQLFSADPKLGTLLPFSIVVQELTDQDVEVTTIDPEWLFQSIEAPFAHNLALQVKKVFRDILERL